MHTREEADLTDNEYLRSLLYAFCMLSLEPWKSFREEKIALAEALGKSDISPNACDSVFSALLQPEGWSCGISLIEKHLKVPEPFLPLLVSAKDFLKDQSSFEELPGDNKERKLSHIGNHVWTGTYSRLNCQKQCRA